MSEEDVRRELEELRKAVHGANKKWYERSPGKEILSHAVAVALASSIALTIHFTTGAPVTIEAKNADRVIALPAMTAPAVPAASALAATAVVADVDAAAAVAADTPPPPLQPTVPAAAPKAHKRVRAAPPPIEVAAAPAAATAAAPAAPAAAAGAPAMPVPVATPVLKEIEIRGRP
jgi:hypothetical protein